METFSLNKKYINIDPIHVSTMDLKILIELEQYQVQFTDDEIFTFKIGNIPNGLFSLLHEKTETNEGIKELPYISFYTEAAKPTLEKISHIVKTVNIDHPTFGLRFNKLHHFFKRDLSNDDVISKLDFILKSKFNQLDNYRKNSTNKNKTYYEKCNKLLKEYEQLDELRNEIKSSPNEFSFLESNYFRFNMIDYVYLKFTKHSNNFERKRFNLCTKLPNAIILNEGFKKSLNRRSDKKLDKVLLEHSTILSDDLYPYDIFFKRKN